MPIPSTQRIQPFTLTSNQCCQPKTCTELGKQCGSWPNGCGGQIGCGPCPGGQVCLTNGTCCIPLSCSGKCGYSGSDGCGGSVTCPPC